MSPSPASESRRLAPATLAARSARSGFAPGAPLAPPLAQSTTWAHARLDAPPAHTYARASNPTVAQLEAALAALEDAPA